MGSQAPQQQFQQQPQQMGGLVGSGLSAPYGGTADFSTGYGQAVPQANHLGGAQGKGAPQGNIQSQNGVPQLFQQQSMDQFANSPLGQYIGGVQNIGPVPAQTPLFAPQSAFVPPPPPPPPTAPANKPGSSGSNFNPETDDPLFDVVGG